MSPETRDPAGMGWEQGTFAGSERAQLIVWSKLSLRQKLSAVEELCDLSRRLLERRQKAGLPYFDPDTGALVNGKH